MIVIKAKILSADRTTETTVICPYCEKRDTFPTLSMDKIYKQKCSKCAGSFKVDVKGLMKQIHWL